MSNEMKKTHVRYTVQYQDRNYEYALHSAKRHFIRNIADVVNILEYCVTQDLKKDLYNPSDKLYNFKVVRLVNDLKETTPDAMVNEMNFNETMKKLVDRIVKDSIQRNS